MDLHWLLLTWFPNRQGSFLYFTFLEIRILDVVIIANVYYSICMHVCKIRYHHALCSSAGIRRSKLIFAFVQRISACLVEGGRTYIR